MSSFIGAKTLEKPKYSSPLVLNIIPPPPSQPPKEAEQRIEKKNKK